jgi:hypothetical protein
MPLGKPTCHQPSVPPHAHTFMCLIEPHICEYVASKPGYEVTFVDTEFVRWNEGEAICSAYNTECSVHKIHHPYRYFKLGCPKCNPITPVAPKMSALDAYNVVVTEEHVRFLHSLLISHGSQTYI